MTMMMMMMTMMRMMMMMMLMMMMMKNHGTPVAEETRTTVPARNRTAERPLRLAPWPQLGQWMG